MSFPNKKIYIGIHYPEKVMSGQISVGTSSGKLMEIHYFDRVSKKGLQVPGAYGSVSRGFGTVPLPWPQLTDVLILPIN